MCIRQKARAFTNFSVYGEICHQSIFSIADLSLNFSAFTNLLQNDEILLFNKLMALPDAGTSCLMAICSST